MESWLNYSKKNKKTSTLTKKKKRCPNGSRRNKKTRKCDKKTSLTSLTIKKKRCPNGSRRSKKTGNCEKHMQTQLQTQSQTQTQLNKRKIAINENIDISKQQELFLKKICPKSSDCIILGKYLPIIKYYFDGMNFKYVADPIVRIGKPSENGFVNELKFVKNNYTAYCVLKSSSNAKADNLFYEYLIGKYFVNKYVSKFPCFLETYAICEYKDTKSYNIFKNNAKTSPQSLLNGVKKITETTVNYDNVCKDTTNIAILIQHMQNPVSLADWMKAQTSEMPYGIELLNILLQIYIPLGTLMNVFTHNDLHANNILLYTVPGGNHVTLTYVVNIKNKTQKITIKTKYIAKIIDYGRSFFKNDNNFSSETVFNKIMKKCPKHKNLSDYGMDWFDGYVDNSNFYTSALIGNISKDLNLVYYVTELLKHQHPLPFDNFLSSMISLLKKINNNDSKHPYGGPPVVSKKCNMLSKNSCNVELLSFALIQFCKKNKNVMEGYDKIYLQKHKNIGHITVHANDLKKDSTYVPDVV